MTDTPVYSRPVVAELRVGNIFSRAAELFAANAVQFIIVTAIVAIPSLFLEGRPAPGLTVGWTMAAAWPLSLILNCIGQAVILYIAFQYLRGQPAGLGD